MSESGVLSSCDTLATNSARRRARASSRDTANRYLARPAARADVLSTFAGIRPLVRGGAVHTAALSRDHLIRVEAPGLLEHTTLDLSGQRLGDAAFAALAYLVLRPH